MREKIRENLELINTWVAKYLKDNGVKYIVFYPKFYETKSTHRIYTLSACDTGICADDSGSRFPMGIISAKLYDSEIGESIILNWDKVKDMLKKAVEVQRKKEKVIMNFSINENEVKESRKTYIRLTDMDVDGNGSNIDAILQAEGKHLTNEISNNIKEAISSYKAESEGCWDTDGCLDAAMEYLKKEGYILKLINPDIEICF